VQFPGPTRRTVPGLKDAPLRLEIRLWLTATLAGLALVLAVSGWWWVRHQGAPITIAVLPLNNLSEDSANDYFADGLTYEIIRNLSIIGGLAVRSQTSSFAFKGKPRNVREAGKQLDAEYILAPGSSYGSTPCWFGYGTSRCGRAGLTGNWRMS
jgi:hypothetical protein